MRIRTAGRINKHLWQLGREESCVYLLEGSKSSAIISGGINYIIPDVLQQIKQFGIEPMKIGHIIILHAHFDHVGIVPFFKRNWPRLTVYASPRGCEVIAKPMVIETFNKYSNLITGQLLGQMKNMSLWDWEWRDDIKGVSLAEGEKIDLGNLTIEIFETPGHSSCSISAYVPELQALFPSDAAPIPYRDKMIVAANSNFTHYQKSLEKLVKLKVKMLGADHYGHVIDDEAVNYIGASIDEAGAMRSKLENILKKLGSIDQAAQFYLDDFYKKNNDYLITQDIMIGTYRQTMKHLAANMSSD